MVDILPISERTMFTYSLLTLNEAMDYRDPSDQKFSFYRNQGLDLIEY